MGIFRLRECLAALAMFGHAAVAQDQSDDEIPLGCILLNVEIESVELAPWADSIMIALLADSRHSLQARVFRGVNLQATIHFNCISADSWAIPDRPDAALSFLWRHGYLSEPCSQTCM
jgi:hypothetical protein